METKKSISKKHLVGVKIGSAREFFVFNTKKQANDYVKALKKEYKNIPNLEIIQTVKPINP
jgi:hypothetical protein